MQERLMQLLTELVAKDSVSYSDKETLASDYVYETLSEMPYFKEHPDQIGKYIIEGDPFGRYIPYGVVLGTSKDTVILSGHTDVVSTEMYGKAEPLAYTIGEELEEAIGKMTLTDIQRADLESGEWIWGRGAADMKAGDVLNMYNTEEIGKRVLAGEETGSIVFLAVPDEESYSTGMRHASALLGGIMDKYGLNYKLLVTTEPGTDINGTHVFELGTVGKSMPVIMCQGAAAHIGNSFAGLSATNLIANLYQRINGSLRYSDQYEDEVTMPAGWANMRDMKLRYDVTLPYRAYGYFTVLSYTSTVEEIIERVRADAEAAFDEEVEKWDETLQKYLKMRNMDLKMKIDYQTVVYTFEELTAKLREEKGEEFDAFWDKTLSEVKEKLAAGDNFPAVTVYAMDQVLNFADSNRPLILIGMAPPYYPPTHSDMVAGKEGFGTALFGKVKEVSESLGQAIVSENYFLGISDNSYTDVPDFDYDMVAKNYPVWGDLYEIDFQNIRKIAVPSVLYGPIGRDYHTEAERLNKDSFLRIAPAVLKEIIEFAWNY